jgi:hypothetical protein
MASTIKLKTGSGAPTAGDLVTGEPALDLTNKRLYTEDSVGTVIEVGTNPSSLSINGTAITATAAELNYTDGVTSNIQTQLDAKAPIASPTFTGTLTATTVDINGGNIDDTVIGATTPRAGTFNVLTADGITTLNGPVTINDEDLILSGANPAITITDETNPNTFKLSVADGTISYRADVNSEWGTTRHLFYTDQVENLRIAGSGDISFYDSAGSSQSFYWDASEQRLGLGTTSPATVLDIAVAGSFSRTYNDFTGDGIRIRCDGTDAQYSYGGSISFTRIAEGGANKSAAISAVQTGVDQDLVGLSFFVHDSGNVTTALKEAMRIDADGNVAIGTHYADPAIDIGARLELAAFNQGVESNTLRFKDRDTSATTPQTTGKIEFYTSDSTNEGVQAYIKGETNSTAKGSIIFAAGNPTTIAERMRIDGLGDISFYEDTGTTEDFYWDASTSSLGLGTTTPARTLHVNDVMRLEPRASAPGSASAGDIFFNSTTSKLQCYDGTTWQDCF